MLDFAADYVIVRLKERGVPYFRVNSEAIAESAITVENTGGTWMAHLSNASGTVVFEEVTSVWLRRRIQARSTRATVEDNAYAAGELDVLLESVFASIGARWINPSMSTHLAERKLYVLRVASEVGFKVPATVATNSPSTFARQVAPRSAGWIAKPLYHGVAVRNGDLFAVQTRRLSDLGVLSPETIAASPTIFQEEVPRGRDLRLTVVGDRVFGAAVRWDAERHVDWRARDAAARFEAMRVDPLLEARVLAMMARLGLVYGAIDLIETPSGDCVFLEVNPAGEFAWLEVQLGLPIRDALIDEMTRSI